VATTLSEERAIKFLNAWVADVAARCGDSWRAGGIILVVA
jgi:hypothetical protein